MANRAIVFGDRLARITAEISADSAYPRQRDDPYLVDPKAPVRRLLMDMIHVDWLPLRFWLAALGGTSIMLLGLLAVGAIDDGAGEDVGATAMFRAANAARP